MYKLQRIFSGFVLLSVQVVYWIISSIVDIKYFYQKRLALAKSQEILDWVKTQNIPLDTSESLKLPDHIVNISHDGLVQVLHTSEDSYCVAIIIQYKYTTGATRRAKGIFVCDFPLNHRYLTKIPDICHRINILGEYQKPYKVAWAFTNLEVEKQYNDCLFAVYRQLG
ncbi:hypothetical protein FJR38_06010 [Anabaena sp. UHCC 0253]|uniref:hypothetical protein n=1 Tax=Anabaena sp. UHCC 0253 TaxID=2590019 RepID=UPI001446A0C6|nr:hypothetical protein [Anabaena sp. UHCC 0253]MTJ52253.1 hypothetical protein [Anabaena sp. UHCC 0253]